MIFAMITALVSILWFAYLELNKNTVFGWILASLVLAVFIYVNRQFKIVKTVKRGTSSGFKILDDLNASKDNFVRNMVIRVCSWIVLAVAIVLISVFTVGPYKIHPAVDVKNPQVTAVRHVEQGDLTGVYTADQQVEVYAGIPYAKPPVGELRWREPQDPDAWEGVLAADHFAPMSMQPTNSQVYNSLAQIIGYHDYEISIRDNHREPMSEDSLYLNIWKPAGEDLSGLPVVVFIHGGSLQTGQTWNDSYNGQGLANQGVIVVNMAYRLGVFGFYADSELAAESPNGTTGNYGLLDQIKALEWVHDNIAVFGGDPENVTLAGESAGSACVSALCTSPLAKGLFTRAVGESSSVTGKIPPHSYRLLDEALATGEETKKALGASNIADMRALSAEQLVYYAETEHHITIDGYALEKTPYEYYKAGEHNETALLNGYNSEESKAFNVLTKVTTGTYDAMTREILHDGMDDEAKIQTIMDAYPAADDDQALDNYLKLNTVLYFANAHDEWTKQAIKANEPVWEYYFSKNNGSLGAWHSGEMIYLYGNIPADSKLYDESDRKLSAIMSSYMVNFARTGDPNDNGEGKVPNAGRQTAVEKLGIELPVWNQQKNTETIMELGENIGIINEPFADVYQMIQ